MHANASIVETKRLQFEMIFFEDKMSDLRSSPKHLESETLEIKLLLFVFIIFAPRVSNYRSYAQNFQNESKCSDRGIFLEIITAIRQSENFFLLELSKVVNRSSSLFSQVFVLKKRKKNHFARINAI